MTQKDTYVVLWRVRQRKKKRIYERWSTSSAGRKSTSPDKYNIQEEKTKQSINKGAMFWFCWPITIRFKPD